MKTAKQMLDNYAIEQGFAVAEDGTPEAQLKSADPITYDDNGNVIPLTERFNQKNDDIRYSKKVNLSNKSLTNSKSKRYNKNSTYDEFRTNGMQWAYSAGTEAGDTRHLFDGWNGKHCIIEATKRDVGFIVIEELSSTEWRKNMDETARLKKKEEAFIGILINMNLPKEDLVTIATALNTEEKMDELYSFLKKKDFKATKQEIWNETGRIIKKYK